MSGRIIYERKAFRIGQPEEDDQPRATPAALHTHVWLVGHRLAAGCEQQ